MEKSNRSHLQRPIGDDINPANARQPDAAPASFLAEHTVTDDDTLSHIALKYYGSAVKEKWMLIYEANQAVIGEDPGKLRPGIVLKIPKLAE